MTCFLMLVLAVIAERTVSLVWLSKHPDTDADASLVSLFAGASNGSSHAAHCGSMPLGGLVTAMIPQCPGGRVLAMDRTNWQFGRTHINIIVVSVIIGKVSLPLAWRVPPKSTKKGNSRKFHRIAVMVDVLSILPAGASRAST